VFCRLGMGCEARKGCPDVSLIGPQNGSIGRALSSERKGTQTNPPQRRHQTISGTNELRPHFQLLHHWVLRLMSGLILRCYSRRSLHSHPLLFGFCAAPCCQTLSRHGDGQQHREETLDPRERNGFGFPAASIITMYASAHEFMQTIAHFDIHQS
jgi:hypothetical protein